MKQIAVTRKIDKITDTIQLKTPPSPKNSTNYPNENTNVHKNLTIGEKWKQQDTPTILRRKSKRGQKKNLKGEV